MIGPPPALPGLAPGDRASPRAWGKFKRHFWGRSLRQPHDRLVDRLLGADAVGGDEVDRKEGPAPPLERPPSSRSTSWARIKECGQGPAQVLGGPSQQASRLGPCDVPPGSMRRLRWPGQVSAQGALGLP
jgi:hypothetical protein